MPAKVEGDYIVFSSGRRCYANGGIVGLSPSLEVSEGYDGPIWPTYEPAVGEDWLTKGDLLELCDHMVDRWRSLRARLQQD